MIFIVFEFNPAFCFGAYQMASEMHKQTFNTCNAPWRKDHTFHGFESFLVLLRSASASFVGFPRGESKLLQRIGHIGKPLLLGLVLMPCSTQLS